MKNKAKKAMGEKAEEVISELKIVQIGCLD